MAVTITIAGTPRQSQIIISTLLIRLEQGAEWSATFDTTDDLSTSGAYRPVIDQSVVIANGATVWLAGKIVGVSDSELVSVKGTRVKVECRANLELTLQSKVSIAYAAGFTLKQILVDLANTFLVPYFGATFAVNPGMAAGPTMGDLTFDDVTFAEAANYLATLTGWLWRHTTTAGIEMFAVGDKVAAFSMTKANRMAQGMPRWTQRRTTGYFNAVTVRYGTSGPRQNLFTATGTGAVSSWVLDYPAMLSPNGVILSRGLVTENGAEKTLGMTGDGTSYTYSAATNAITRAAGALPAGHVITLIYTVMYPQTVFAQDATEIAAHGRYQVTREAPDIFDKAEATTLAAALLRQNIAAPKEITLPSRPGGPAGFELPGTVMTLTYTDRLISGTYLILATEVRIIADKYPQYTYRFVEGDETLKTATQELRSQLSGSISGSTGTVTGSVLPSFSGHFPGDVIANTGDQAEEVFVGVVGNQGSYSAGPGWWANRNPNVGAGRGSWAMISDQASGDKDLRFQDRAVAAVGAYTFRIWSTAANDYTLHAATGVTLRLGSASNRLGSVHTSQLEVTGAQVIAGSAIISPATLTANTNNWNPAGLSTARVIIFGTDASRNITGLVAQTAGTVITLVNGGANPGVLKYNDTANSTAANCFILPALTDLTLGAGAAATFLYDGTAARWRCLGS